MAAEVEAGRAGGQAVFDGVMMRYGDRWAVAVRVPSGAIEVLRGDVPGFGRRWRDVPLARGIVALAEALPLGMRTLTWSAERTMPDKVRPKRWYDTPIQVVVVAAVVALFFAVPGLTAMALGADSALSFNLVEGAVRLTLLLAYLLGISRVPEVGRLFENHGAEHKVVAAYETGAPLTPASAARFTTRHVRCGTSFLLCIAVVSVLVHLAAGRPDLPVLIASRIALIPVVAAIAAELQLRAAEHVDKGWVRALLRPGLALQRLTTREPDHGQLEVAIVALEAVLPAGERAQVEARTHADVPVAVPELV